MQRILIIAAVFLAPLFAQSPAAAPTTKVLAILSVASGVQRDAIMKVMQSEVRDTVKLYLDGHIEQWFSRADGTGVLFILDCKSVDEAKAMLEALPLAKQKLATFEYIPLGPLTPLRMLIASPPVAAQ